MVIYRPINAAKFNGTVVVEWLNVTAGQDLPNGWTMAHNEFIRHGVGVSGCRPRRWVSTRSRPPSRVGTPL